MAHKITSKTLQLNMVTNACATTKFTMHVCAVGNLKSICAMARVMIRVPMMTSMTLILTFNTESSKITNALA